MTQRKNQFVFRILCKDSPGIVARVTNSVLHHKGNILNIEQHVEEDSGLFAMRFQVEHLASIEKFQQELKASPWEDFQYWTNDLSHVPRMAIMVTKEETCLYDLIIKQQMQELPCEIPLIISNHAHLQHVAEKFNIPFFHVPFDNANNDASRKKQETQVAKLLEEHKVDLVVLARYMRILSENFVNQREGQIINIHHSFLPAFKGANPYRQAWERGVKLIGATAHYVSADLDEGPIIHQKVTRVDHQYSVKELTRVGREVERLVLTDAVRAHLEHRVLLIGKRTIVFSI